MSSAPVSRFAQRSLADLVIEDPRVATVLDRFGLDYCCRGDQTLAEAVQVRGVVLAEVEAALVALGRPQAGARAVEREAVEEIVGRIRAWHRRYREEIAPVVRQRIGDVAERNADARARMVEIEQAFDRLHEKLSSHIRKEESILLPFIDDLARAVQTGTRLPPLGSILHPIRFMEAEHQQVIALLDTLRTLVAEYRGSNSLSADWGACRDELMALAHELHLHLHLENNVLFPRALALGSQML